MVISIIRRPHLGHWIRERMEYPIITLVLQDVSFNGLVHLLSSPVKCIALLSSISKYRVVQESQGIPSRKTMDMKAHHRFSGFCEAIIKALSIPG